MVNGPFFLKWQNKFPVWLCFLNRLLSLVVSGGEGDENLERHGTFPPAALRSCHRVAAFTIKCQALSFHGAKEFKFERPEEFGAWVLSEHFAHVFM